MTPKENLPGRDLPKHLRRPPQSSAILRAVTGGRPVWARLTEWQIAPQNQKAGSGKPFRHSHQQGCAAIRSRSVCQDQ